MTDSDIGKTVKAIITIKELQHSKGGMDGHTDFRDTIQQAYHESQFFNYGTDNTPTCDIPDSSGAVLYKLLLNGTGETSYLFDNKYHVDTDFNLRLHDGLTGEFKKLSDNEMKKALKIAGYSDGADGADGGSAAGADGGSAAGADGGSAAATTAAAAATATSAAATATSAADGGSDADGGSAAGVGVGDGTDGGSATIAAAAAATATSAADGGSDADATAQPQVQVVPSIFQKKGASGDFFWEIDNDYEPNTTLYVFNDNATDHKTPHAGEGNGVIRQFNKYSSKIPVRSAGVCTGDKGKGGYSELTQKARDQIDSDIEEIRDLLNTVHYKKVKYSGDGKGSLGTNHFGVGTDVKAYIVSSLHALADTDTNASESTYYNYHCNCILKEFKKGTGTNNIISKIEYSKNEYEVGNKVRFEIDPDNKTIKNLTSADADSTLTPVPAGTAAAAASDADKGLSLSATATTFSPATAKSDLPYNGIVTQIKKNGDSIKILIKSPTREHKYSYLVPLETPYHDFNLTNHTVKFNKKEIKANTKCRFSVKKKKNAKYEVADKIKYIFDS